VAGDAGVRIDSGHVWTNRLRHQPQARGTFRVVRVRRRGACCIGLREGPRPVGHLRILERFLHVWRAASVPLFSRLELTRQHAVVGPRRARHA
jgi:hypothetical protein